MGLFDFFFDDSGFDPEAWRDVSEDGRMSQRGYERTSP